MTLGEHFANHFKKSNAFAVEKFPFKVPVADIHQVWHSQHQNDLAHKWLRNQIKTAALEI